MEWFRWFLFIGLLAACFSLRYRFLLTKCNDQSTIDLVEGQAASITCTGLVWHHNIYWTVTSPTPNNVETTVGGCESCVDYPRTCSHPCVNCNQACSNTNVDYQLSRTQQFTTLHFTTVLQSDDGAVIKCSSRDNRSQASCTINVIKGAAYPFVMTQCNNDGKLYIVKNQAVSVTCTGLVWNHSIYWTIQFPNTVATRVGQCGRCVACEGACSSISNHVQITRRERNTTLNFTTGVDRAVVKCSRLNNLSQAACVINVIKAIRIQNCVNNEVVLFENRITIIGCFGLDPSQRMYWAITNSSGYSSRIAECEPCPNAHSCAACSSLNTDYLVARTQVSSNLTIMKNKRQKVGWILKCSEVNNVRSAQCNVRVQYPAELGNPRIRLDGWNLVGTVVINKVYDSDNDIHCSWVVNGPTSINGLRTTSRISSLGSNGGGYMNGTCILSLPLNASEGVYHLGLTVRPGGTQILVGNVAVEKPGALLLEPQTCPVFVAEGTNLECPCHHASTQEGSPTAFVTWSNADNGSVLSVNKVHRKQNGNEYTCRSVWGPKKDLIRLKNYTLRVAYGPTDAVVYSQTYVINGTKTVTLHCTCDDVYPSVNINWSVPCMTFTLTSRMSTCSVTKATWDNIQEVMCFAYNSKFKDVNITYTYRHPVQNQDQVDGGDVPLEYIAGGTAAAVVVIAAVIVVVIVITVKRRNRTYERPRRRRNRKEDPHMYSDLQPGAITGSPTPPNTADSSNSNLQPNNSTNNVRNRSVTKEGRENGGDHVCDGARSGNQDVQKPNIVYLNVRSSQGSDAAAYYNATGDVQAAHSDDGDNDHYYSQVKDVESAGPDLDSSVQPTGVQPDDSMQGVYEVVN